MTLDASLIERITRLSPEKRLLLEQRMTSGVTSGSSPVAHGDVDKAPTSYAQRSQWFVNHLDLDNPFFNKTDAVRVRGPLDIIALREAVSALVARHAVLRTGYRLDDEGPVQVVFPPSPMEVPVVGLAAGVRQDAELQRHLAAEQRRPFDLETGPMYRVHVVKLGEDHHVLVRTNHHIAFDRWSSAIANAELSALYVRYSSGDGPELEPLPYQYTDFARWQRSNLDDQMLARHLEFATAHLAGVKQTLDLPVDHSRPEAQSHRGASYHTSFDPGLVGRIREVARAEGATPFMFCLAGFGVLLGRYARTDQFLIGVPAAGRNAEGSETLIGLFINSMVIRLDLRGDPSFSGLVTRVRTAALGAMSHQELPFEVLVENLAKERAPGRTPVFQVMLDYINTPGADLTLGSLDLEAIPIADEASVYDINLYLYDDGTEIRAKWEYRSDLFDRPTIVRMSEALATVLEGAVADTSQPLSALPLVSPADRIRISNLGEGPTNEIPANGSFLAQIGIQARAQPDSAALVSGDTVFSYRELWNLVMGVSRHIDSVCAPDARVAIVTGRSTQLVPALLGTLHSGRTAVMVDTNQPENRLSTMLDQVEIGAVISGGEGLGVDLVADVPDIAVRPLDDGSPAPKSAAVGENPAYVVFTSGSTGTPRGVAVGRGALENFVDDTYQRYQPGPGDRFLQFASPGFDTLIEEVIPTLMGGATLVMRPPELFSSFAEFTSFVETNVITVLDLPTAWWHAWVDDMVRTGVTSIPGCVRLVIIGGEAAGTDRWRTWQTITGGRVRLVNSYGPSESTVVVATFEPPRDWSPGTSVMPIGRPIRNTRLLVVGENGAEVPPGVPGELVIAGAPVGNGYLDDGVGRSGFEEKDGSRRYHTGDLVRMSVAGEFEYVGRIDDQFKINGIRIEPGEIESALIGHQSVDDAVVVTTDTNGGRELVGHVVAPASFDIADLRLYLSTRLPASMVPGRIHVHSSFPLTPSGKVDRVALRDVAPDIDRDALDVTIDRAPNPTERRLSRVWEMVMPQPGAGLDDDFFAIGGHSLLGVRLISHATDEFGVALPLRIIYEAPTIASMAAWIDRELELADTASGLVDVG